MQIYTILRFLIWLQDHAKLFIRWYLLIQCPGHHMNILSVLNVYGFFHRKLTLSWTIALRALGNLQISWIVTFELTYFENEQDNCWWIESTMKYADISRAWFSINYIGNLEVENKCTNQTSEAATEVFYKKIRS